MRRWAAALGLGLILATAAGCGGVPAGLDGDIVKGWGPMPAAVRQFRPRAGTCHALSTEESGVSEAADYHPVPCAGPHKVETAAVFDLTAGDSASSPERLAKAFSECSKRADAWLGNDWRLGWTTIVPVLPGAEAWTGGARWIRCDVAQISPRDNKVLERKGSMKGSLKPGGRLLMTCANTVDHAESFDVSAARCGARHNAEFAGLYRSTASNPDDVTEDEMKKRCAPVIAKFAGVPNDRNLYYRIGWMALPGNAWAWYRGDHSVHCFLWFGDEPVTGSYRKAGSGRLPVH